MTYDSTPLKTLFIWQYVRYCVLVKQKEPSYYVSKRIFNPVYQRPCMLGCVYALRKSKIWRTDQNRRQSKEWGIFDMQLYKGMVRAIQRRKTTRIRGQQQKNRAQINSGAVIWAPSFPQKSQQLPPSLCGAPKKKFKRVRGWDCVKHFIFRRT